MAPDAAREQLPERIQARLSQLETELEEVVGKARAEMTAELPGPVAFRLTHSAPLPFPSFELQAQALGFVIRFDQLPQDYTARIGQAESGYEIVNLDYVRHVLNDYRPLINNQNDSVYFKNVHSAWYRFFLNEDSTRGLRVQAMNGKADVTPQFRTWIGQRQRGLIVLLDHLEFDYLYNGILQHSDHRFNKRFVDEYVSGELNYVLWKHMAALAVVRDMLVPYYRLVHAIAFPRRGLL